MIAYYATYFFCFIIVSIVCNNCPRVAFKRKRNVDQSHVRSGIDITGNDNWSDRE